MNRLAPMKAITWLENNYLKKKLKIIWKCLLTIIGPDGRSTVVSKVESLSCFSSIAPPPILLFAASMKLEIIIPRKKYHAIFCR